MDGKLEWGISHGKQNRDEGGGAGEWKRQKGIRENERKEKSEEQKRGLYCKTRSTLLDW